MSDLSTFVDRYGGNPSLLLRFDGEDAPELLPYATLTGARQGGSPDLQALVGVYEWQDNPLIYLVDREQLGEGSTQLRRIRRRVALHGDAPYLGVIEAGRLTLHAVAVDKKGPDGSRIQLEIDDGVTFPYLAAQRPKIAAARGTWIADLIRRLLRETLRNLRSVGVRETDAISLAGRALFTRFLADRDLVPQSPVAGTEVYTLFDDPERIARTCAWLDDTFNGDLLPLSPQALTRLRLEICRSLGNIMRRAEGGQLHLGWKQGWDYLDFAHIPVGVLSQAYEGYLREQAPERQRKQSGYFTPLPIAETLVRGAFYALRDEGRAHTARVLDPAAGAGVFLITAYRQLVAEHWRHSGIRPDTQTLRDILYGQLTGFDIDEAGLRFAALGLYLMAIELDAQPEPVEKLRFAHDLRDRVLWKVGDLDREDDGGLIGSLGSEVGDQHRGRYDLVVGNPPWTGARRIPGWNEVTERVTAIARQRLGEETPPPPIPNQVPDLPFLWHAMEWARPGGQIALALHARLLFAQGDGMPEARSALFSALDVTSVINGSELRNTKVWPQITAPFCLLFGRNRLPPPGAGLRFLNPHREPGLNGAGIMRLDPANAEVVSARQLQERPTLLKTLFRGTRLDLEILERIEARGLPTLDSYWRKLFGEFRGRARQTGNGYQRLRTSSRPRKSGDDGQPGIPADYLHSLRELTAADLDGLVVDHEKLEQFNQSRIHDPRRRSLFTAPLTVVRESPPTMNHRIVVAMSEQDVVFNQSVYGYSTKGHRLADSLARYLALLIGSQLSLWYSLVVSGKFGFERPTIEKATIDSLPLVPIEDLDEDNLEALDRLFEAPATGDGQTTWADADRWVASLYGLNERDLQVIEDTLAYHLPFSTNREAAHRPPDSPLQAVFCETLQSELQPWVADQDRRIDVRAAAGLPAHCPWQLLLLTVGAQGHSDTASPSSHDWEAITRLADRTGIAEILHPVEGGRAIWIGRLRQARYWSRSQARLLAQRIVWEQGSLLFDGD